MQRSRMLVSSKVSDWQGVAPMTRAFADGLTQATAADSALSLYNAGNRTSGKYWIKINGTPTQVYCDMTDGNGGWMLYSSFGTGNPLEATNYPAISGNRININTLNANGWTTATSDGSTYNYNDGTNNNSGYTITQPDNTSWFAFFASSTPPYGFLYLNTFKFATPVISQIKIKWGDPTNNGSVNNELYVNGTLYPQGGVVIRTDTISYAQSAVSGANSIYLRETSINGISWMYVR